jgi:uncharacterized protein YjbI with pentapeptide repeats
MTDTSFDLPEILASHKKWRAREPGGKRADLAGAILRGTNLFGADLYRAILDDADLSHAYLYLAILSGAYLTRANLTGANLSYAHLYGTYLYGTDLTNGRLDGANLTDASLDGANLTNANLDGADLTNASLDLANLTGASLDGANLTGASLDGANLTDAIFTPAPAIPNIDARILEAISANVANLDMEYWHVCKTTHCRAGWAIVLAGEKGKALEAKIGPWAAGAAIYAASRPGVTVPNFYASNEEALADLRECAARNPIPTAE